MNWAKTAVGVGGVSLLLSWVLIDLWLPWVQFMIAVTTLLGFGCFGLVVVVWWGLRLGDDQRQRSRLATGVGLLGYLVFVPFFFLALHLGPMMLPVLSVRAQVEHRVDGTYYLVDKYRDDYDGKPDRYVIVYRQTSWFTWVQVGQYYEPVGLVPRPPPSRTAPVSEPTPVAPPSMRQPAPRPTYQPESHQLQLVADGPYAVVGLDKAGPANHNYLFRHSKTGWNPVVEVPTTLGFVAGTATDAELVLTFCDVEGRNEVWRYGIAAGRWKKL